MKNERILSMQYPLISEYVRAIQDAQNNLDKLAHLSPVLDDHGEPYRSSGAFAVVFKMKDEQTGKCYALKCFTEEQEGRAEAYRKIGDELEYVGSPYVVSVRYLEKELFVDSNCEEEEFPVLLMDWIEGETMETYIANNYSDSYAMSMLCYRFCKMAAWLRSQPFAHGDIKPDNIIVRSDGTLTLVDYDGMFVPAMKGQKSPTIGTKDFSHPLRTVDDFDETIDDFALATIALSLKAISLDSSLFNRFGASDRLLFSANDYLDLSKSQVLTALQGLLADEEIRTLLSMLLLASAKKDLSTCSFRLFDVQKPKEDEVWSTEVTEEDLADAVEDEYGVKYSRNWKRLLKASQDLKGKYVIREGVRVICNRSFWRCSIESITIPNSVASIGDCAFSDCGSLASITIPRSVVSINGNPFALWYGSLHNESEAFIYENNILFNEDKTILIAYRAKDTNYVISDGVRVIGDRAFYRCNALKSITIPNSVTSIGDCAFSDCDSLASITIPRRVVSIKGNPFALWHGSLHNESEAFIYENNILFNKDKTILIAYRAKDTNYVIPDGVISIVDCAFCCCDSLRSITIPNSVTSIGGGVFEGCSSLESITIPNGVISIGYGAFYNCTSLISIIIPDSVVNISDYAFGGCYSLGSITIPNSVTSIGEYAFLNCSSLKSITIPNSVISIGWGAFISCNSLKSITIPNSVTSIGEGAFYGCYSLKDITIPDGITSLGDCTFGDCGNLNPQIKAEIKRRFGEKVFNLI